MISQNIGYSRWSTTHQPNDGQVAALKETGCEVVLQESISTRTAEKDRAQLQDTMPVFMAEERKQAKVSHAYWVVSSFGLLIKTTVEIDRFLEWF